jgi:hypothetical protein
VGADGSLSCDERNHQMFKRVEDYVVAAFLTMKFRWWLSPVARDRPEKRQEWNNKKSFLYLTLTYLASLRNNTQIQVDEPE